MIIYRNNIVYFVFDFEPRGRERRQLMEEHSVSISFELSKHKSFEKGDSIVYNGKSFFLAKDYISTINKSTGGYIYDLTFHDITERFKDILLKYEMEGVKELDFTIISSGGNLLDIVIASLSQIGTFTKGLAPISKKEFRFQNISVYEALNLIAEQYEMEWWLEEDTLNIGKLEFGTPVILAHDRELDDISFSPSSQEMPTRLYAFGSTKNLPIDYGVSGDTTNAIFENRLRLPSGYIDLFPNLPESQVVEGVKIFEDVFPRQQNEVIEVMETLIGETTIYSFRGDNTFVLTQENVISGQALKVAFETGNLAGREFDLIIKGNNWFEIKYQQSGERVIPNQTLKPTAGDKFFFFNFDVGSVLPSLVTDAESELASKAQEFLDKLGEEYVYTVRTRSVYCRENSIDLSMGQTVTITSPAIGSRTSRVMGYEKDMFDIYECSYEIGDYSKYSRLKELEAMAKSETDTQSLRDTLMGYFADGVVDAVELSNIEAILASIQRERDRYFGQYNVFISNEYLADKTQIQAAWTAYDSAYSSVASAIQSAIADGIVTAEEMAQIDTAMAEYSSSLIEYARQEQLANKSITDLISSTLTQWASDGLISPTEKLAIKQTRQRIAIEKQTVTEGANKYSIPLTAYDSAWAAYDAVLGKYSAATPENIPLDTDFALAEEAYKAAKIAIDNAITNAQKAEIETKQPSGNYLTWGEFDELFEVHRNATTNAIESVSVHHPFFGEYEISAYGIGNGAGSGTSYTRLDDWLQYVAGTSEGYVLSALLGKDLYDKLMTLTGRVDAVEGGDSDKHFAFTQGTPASVWTVNHNLNKYPAVMIVDSGQTEVIGEITYIDLNTVEVSFSSAFSGKAFCN